jgi:hypothetical protein
MSEIWTRTCVSAGINAGHQQDEIQAEPNTLYWNRFAARQLVATSGETPILRRECGGLLRLFEELGDGL